MSAEWGGQNGHCQRVYPLSPNDVNCGRACLKQRGVDTLNYSPIEQEAIVLNAVLGMIDDMVNHANFCLPAGTFVDKNLLPKTDTTLRVFNILLADFLSPLSARKNHDLPFGLPRPIEGARTSDFTFLFYLKRACTDPRLGSDVAALKKMVELFSAWLEAKSVVEDVWFHSIKIKVNLAVERREWIRICGDIAKHNFARLEPNVRKIVRILDEHNKSVPDGRGYELLPEFSEWFHINIFAYHASTIAEFLNDIRWELYAYLKPEFARAVQYADKTDSYPFHVPEAIGHPLARSMYWELMNRCRSGPMFPKFTITQSLKKRY